MLMVLITTSFLSVINAVDSFSGLFFKLFVCCILPICSSYFIQLSVSSLRAFRQDGIYRFMCCVLGTLWRMSLKTSAVISLDETALQIAFRNTKDGATDAGADWHFTPHIIFTMALNIWEHSRVFGRPFQRPAQSSVQLARVPNRLYVLCTSKTTLAVCAFDFTLSKLWRRSESTLSLDYRYQLSTRPKLNGKAGFIIPV